MTASAVPAEGLAVTVLGSGGPFLSPERVSAGYVVWLDGRARLLVDAGGGTFERLGRLEEVDLTGLDAVLLTHLHIDHSGGLAPVVFAAWMAGRTQSLTVVGPAQMEDQPGCAEFCNLLFGLSGAWRYLNTFEKFAVDAREVSSDTEMAEVTQALELPGLTVHSVAVPHGMMPSVAFRVESTGTRPRAVVFSGDVQTDDRGLTTLSRGADLLVHDMALPERDVPHGHLHAKPSEVGGQAARAGVQSLLLSHVMPALEHERDDAERLVRGEFGGEVRWAEDLGTYPV